MTMQSCCGTAAHFRWEKKRTPVRRVSAMSTTTSIMAALDAVNFKCATAKLPWLDLTAQGSLRNHGSTEAKTVEGPHTRVLIFGRSLKTGRRSSTRLRRASTAIMQRLYTEIAPVLYEMSKYLDLKFDALGPSEEEIEKYLIGK